MILDCLVRSHMYYVRFPLMLFVLTISWGSAYAEPSTTRIKAIRATSLEIRQVQKEKGNNKASELVNECYLQIKQSKKSYDQEVEACLVKDFYVTTTTASLFSNLSQEWRTKNNVDTQKMLDQMRKRIAATFQYFQLPRDEAATIVKLLNDNVLQAVLADEQPKIETVPTDLTQLPNIGVEKDEAVKFLDRVVQFSEQKEKYGLSLLSGQTQDGKIHVSFKLANTRVIAGSIAVPDTSQQVSALKSGMVIRFMMNLVPEIDWNSPEQSQLLGDAIAKISSEPTASLSKTIGEKHIFAVRDPKTGLIKFSVINRRMKTERFDIGIF